MFWYVSGSECGRKLEIDFCEKTLTSVIVSSSKYTPSVLKSCNECFGALVKSYPEQTRDRKGVVFHYLKQQLNQQITSKTRKPELPIVEGCLNALNDYLSAFDIDEGDDETRETIYEFVRRVCPKPEDQNARRTSMRAALRLFDQHCKQHFADLIVTEVKFWYETLYKWAFSRNR